MNHDILYSDFTTLIGYRPKDINWKKVRSRPRPSSFKYWKKKIKNGRFCWERPKPRARELERLEKRLAANLRAAQIKAEKTKAIQ